MRYSVVATAEMDGERLDLALVRADIGLSRRKIRAAIDYGGVYVNRKRMRIASRIVRVGDQITLEWQEAAKSQLAKDYALESHQIIYQQDELIVCNKPPGIASQATRSQAVFHMESLVAKYVKNGGRRGGKVRLVHRLDQETSGVMLFALSPRMAEFLDQAFRERAVKKVYHALCYGQPHTPQFQSTAALLKPNHQGQVRQHPSGKPAITGFKMLARLEDNCSLLAAYPETGRTHQIRVHLAALGLPILGDKRYGDRLRTPLAGNRATALNHHMLHAARLQLKGPNGEDWAFEASYPASFEEVLLQLQIHH